jgi:hypothetical protein
MALSLSVAAARADERDWAVDLSRSAYWVGWGMPAALGLFGGSSTHRAGRHVADATVGAVVINQGLKEVFRQGRPNNPDDTAGMPSGHSALVFASATALGDQYHEWRVPLYVWASAVGWSRHRLRAHYWHQVFAGAVVGFSIARISRDSHEGVCRGLFFDEDEPAHFLGVPGTGLPSVLAREATLWEWKMDF